MKTLQYVSMASCLMFAATGLSYADGICDGFEIKLKNGLPDDFIVNKIHLKNGAIQPNHMETLKGNSEQIFTVNNAAKNATMEGELSLHTVSIPSKKIKIKFTLNNKGAYCKHRDKDSGGDYSVSNTRMPGGVNYTING